MTPSPSASSSPSALDLALRPWPLVAATALGLSAGAMLTEAALLVGIWRAMPPAAFLRWFADHEPALVAFYGPLQTATTAAVVLAAVACLRTRRGGAGLWLAATVLTLAVLGLFFAYFAAANASFAAGTIAVDDVPAELRRWSAWQWARTACGVGAFIAGIAALRRTATTGQLAT